MASMIWASRRRLGSNRKVRWCFRCDLGDPESNPWLKIPAWMFEHAPDLKARLAARGNGEISSVVQVGKKDRHSE